MKPSAARAPEVTARLKGEFPEARTELDWSNPLELLVATILSAQTTDVQVNRVTESLFSKYRTAEDYADSNPDELEEDIRPTGFYRNKARSLRGMARALVEEHGGEVPRTMSELVALPGVGRKTANVVIGNAFGTNEGIWSYTTPAQADMLAGELKLGPDSVVLDVGSGRGWPSH